MSDSNETDSAEETGLTVDVKEEKSPAKRKPFAPGQVFGTSKEKEEGGVWMSLGDGAAVKVRRVNYPAAKEHMRKLMKPFAAQVKNGLFTDDDERPILIKILVNHLLVSWKGIFDAVLDAKGRAV